MSEPVQYLALCVIPAYAFETVLLEGQTYMAFIGFREGDLN